MRLKLFRTAFLVAVVEFVLACADVDGLSDRNRVVEFTVLDHAPESIELGDAVIGEDSIVIPVLYGEYDFPLQFTAQVRYEGEIDRVIGVDFNEPIILENIDDVCRFMVQARSGLTRTYVIAAKAADLVDDNNLLPDVQFAHVPDGVEMLPRADVSVTAESSELTMLMIGSYPVTLIPEFALSGGARFESFENGATEMTFTDADMSIPLTVMAESGARRVWDVRLASVDLVSGQDEGVAPEALARTSVLGGQNQFSAIASGCDIDRFVDNDHDRIELSVRASDGGDVTFPLDVTVHMEAAEGAWFSGVTGDTTLRFNHYGDSVRFVVFHPAAREAREWSIGLDAWKDNAPIITSFAYNYTVENDDATLDVTSTMIDASVSQIWLPMTALRTDLGASWHLTLRDVEVGVPDGATCSYDDPIEWSGEEGWLAVHKMVVTAEDGTQRTWRLGLLDQSAPLSSLCEIESFRIESYRPRESTSFDPSEPVTIDAASRRVTLHLVEDAETSYPLTVIPHIEVSDHATLPDRPMGTEPLVFETEQAELPVTVRAQDGTEAVWTVVLDVPERATGNSILSFAVSGLSSAFTPYVSIDEQTSTVTVALVAEVGAGAVESFDYTMTVSSGATVNSGTSGHFEYGSMRETKEITVISEGGDARTWSVRLECKPQFANSSMSTWVNNGTGKWQDPASWATSNNNFVVGTQSGEGLAGGSDLAAVMKTSQTLGKIASGSLFLGEFKFDLGGALADPPKLTWFGVPFAATARVVAMELDVWYHSGGNGDMGSIMFELVNYDQTDKPYEYHGITSKPRTDNTATPVASSYVKVGQSSGDDVITLEDETWTRIRIPLEYGEDTDPAYTHLSVGFASSWQGDLFVGAKNSELRIDNLRLIYE